MSYAERLKEARLKKGLTQGELAQLLGVRSNTISNYEHGVSAPDLDSLAKIIKYLDTSADFILGHGNAAKSVTQVTAPVRKFIRRTDKKLEVQAVPLYDIEATAGLIELFDKTQNILGEISIPNLPKCDGAIKIVGDSMYPILKSGDIVMYQQVTDFQYGIFWGEMYLIQVQLSGDLYMTTVKYLQKSELGDEFIKLVSHNKNHQEKDIPISMVRALAFVKASIRLNSNT